MTEMRTKKNYSISGRKMNCGGYSNPLDENWRALAAAIVIQSVKDYELFQKQLKTPGLSENERLVLERELSLIRKFFRSSWCDSLVYMGLGEDISESSDYFLKVVERMIRNKERAKNDANKNNSCVTA